MPRENARGAQINARMNRLAVHFERLVNVDTMFVDDTFADSIREVLTHEFDDLRAAMLASGMKFSPVVEASCLSDLEVFFNRLSMDIDMGFFAKAPQPYFLIVDANRLTYSWEQSRSQ